MFSRWISLHALPPPLLVLLQILVTVRLPFVTASCSQELALVGYPSCASACFSVCDKYCPSVLVDATCTCRSSAYIQAAYDCLLQACPEPDLTRIVSTAKAGCKAYGYDIAQYFTTSSSGAGTSATGAPPSASTGASSSSGGSGGDSSSGGGGGVPVGTVVGIALGIGIPLLIAIGVVLYCMHRRKQRTAQPAAQPVVVDVAPPLKQEGTYQAPPQPQAQPAPLPVYTSTGQYREMGAGQGTVWNQHVPTEIEGNVPGNAPGWKPPHEMG